MRVGSTGFRAAGMGGLLVLAMAAAAVASGAKADDFDLQPLRNVGDGYKSVNIITKYDLHPETHTMDLTAAEPNDSSISHDTRVDIATQVVHEICANRVIPRGWTIRISLPGDAAPAASCTAGGAPAGKAAHKPAHKHVHKAAHKEAPKAEAPKAEAPKADTDPKADMPKPAAQ